MLMTKPAGCFAQVAGAFLVFLSIGAFAENNSTVGFLMLVCGGGLFFAGGYSARQHMERDRQPRD